MRSRNSPIRHKTNSEHIVDAFMTLMKQFLISRRLSQSVRKTAPTLSSPFAHFTSQSSEAHALSVSYVSKTIISETAPSSKADSARCFAVLLRGKDLDVIPQLPSAALDLHPHSKAPPTSQSYFSRPRYCSVRILEHAFRSCLRCTPLTFSAPFFLSHRTGSLVASESDRLNFAQRDVHLATHTHRGPYRTCLGPNYFLDSQPHFIRTILQPTIIQQAAYL